MKSKIKIVPFLIALIISLLVGKLSLSSDLSLSQYIRHTKSELWAMSHQLKDFKASELINSNRLKLDRDTSTLPETMSTSIVQNFSDSLPYGFPLGWYDSIKNLSTPAKIASEGINLVMPYTGRGNPQEVTAYLDKAAAAGIKVLVHIPRDAIRRGQTAKVTQFVRQLKNHPAVFGWYLFDEPGFIDLSPNLLQKSYQAIKVEDPKHPIAVAFTKLLRVRNYLNSVDIVMYDNYPCIYNKPEFSGFQNGIFAKLAQSAASIAGEKHPFWFIIQGYGEDKYGRPTKFNKRLPTAAEQRYMVYSAILAPADGLLFWSHYLSQQKWIDSVLTPIVREVKNYLPAIQSGALENKLVIDNSKIQGSLYRNPTTNDLLLIAINHSNSEVDTTIAINENSRASSATVSSENRSVAIAGGTLNDTFKPYAVHIYQIK